MVERERPPRAAGIIILGVCTCVPPSSPLPSMVPMPRWPQRRLLDPWALAVFCIRAAQALSITPPGPGGPPWAAGIRGFREWDPSSSARFRFQGDHRGQYRPVLERNGGGTHIGGGVGQAHTLCTTHRVS